MGRSSGVSCDRTTGRKCADAPKGFLRGRSHVGPDLIADGRSVATCAAVAVSSQFVVKCPCTDLDETKVAQRP